MSAVKNNRSKRAIAILWPSFVGAGVFAGFLFAFFDPLTLTHELGIEHAKRITGYSMTFLFRWLLGAVVAFFSTEIIKTPEPKYIQDR